MNDNEPVILGKVKKNGASKPILVIIVFLIIGSIILFIPTIVNYFGDYSPLELIKNGEIIDFFINHDSFVKRKINNDNNDDNDKSIVYINPKSVINYDGITLDKFNLDNDKITFNINNKNNNIDLDKSSYYLVLKQNNKEISIIRLLNQDSIEYNFETRLDSLVNVLGEVKKYSESDYPSHVISSDESGLASIFCNKDNDMYEYIFDNMKVTSIRETYTYSDNSDNNKYLNQFEIYTKLSNNINNNGGVSSIEEDINGFIFKTNIDLKIYKNEINNNYYSYNTNVDKIYFDMRAKGYDCR